MRTLRSTVVLATILMGSSPAFAQEPGTSLQAFGGLALGTVSSTSTTFGAAISGRLTDHVQVIGGGGRIGNVLPRRRRRSSG